MYKLTKDPITQAQDRMVIKKLGNGHELHIPFKDENIHYIEYKAWLAAGNTPEAAD